MGRLVQTDRERERVREMYIGAVSLFEGGDLFLASVSPEEIFALVSLSLFLLAGARLSLSLSPSSLSPSLSTSPPPRVSFYPFVYMHVFYIRGHTEGWSLWSPFACLSFSFILTLSLTHALSRSSGIQWSVYTPPPVRAYYMPIYAYVPECGCTGISRADVSCLSWDCCSAR